jgi:hypothetical protein
VSHAVPLSPTEKRLAGRIGGLRVISRYGAKTIGRRAHAGSAASLDARLLSEIDALAADRGEELSEDDRAERLKYARSAHFSELALKSAAERRRKAAAS